jgi:DNA polymerase V
MQPVFALVDCNNSYVSCERVFQPWLETVPVLMLSNNDGCAIARSNEVKALGVKMGDPFFQIRVLMERHNVQVYSSNYTLYGDMSRRVHDILAQLAPMAEEYSIDESFLRLDGIPEGLQVSENATLLALMTWASTLRNSGVRMAFVANARFAA